MALLTVWPLVSTPLTSRSLLCTTANAWQVQRCDAMLPTGHASMSDTWARLAVRTMVRTRSWAWRSPCRATMLSGWYGSLTSTCKDLAQTLSSISAQAALSCLQHCFDGGFAWCSRSLAADLMSGCKPLVHKLAVWILLDRDGSGDASTRQLHACRLSRAPASLAAPATP